MTSVLENKLRQRVLSLLPYRVRDPFERQFHFTVEETKNDSARATLHYEADRYALEPATILIERPPEEKNLEAQCTNFARSVAHMIEELCLTAYNMDRIFCADIRIRAEYDATLYGITLGGSLLINGEKRDVSPGILP